MTLSVVFEFWCKSIRVKSPDKPMPKLSLNFDEKAWGVSPLTNLCPNHLFEFWSCKDVKAQGVSPPGEPMPKFVIEY